MDSQVDTHHEYTKSCFPFTFRVPSYYDVPWYISGDMYEIGSETGRYYSLNVPLREGMDDASKFIIMYNLPWQGNTNVWKLWIFSLSYVCYNVTYWHVTHRDHFPVHCLLQWPIDT